MRQRPLARVRACEAKRSSGHKNAVRKQSVILLINPKNIFTTISAFLSKLLSRFLSLHLVCTKTR